jgi:hypothetical protein
MNRGRVFLIHSLAGTIVAISALSICGKIFHIPVLSNWGYGVNLSVPGTASFFMVGVALWILSGEHK